jgi:hypothetical protein
MKLIIENWNKFLNEEEIDEGVVSAAKIAAFLASMGLNPQAPEDMDDTGYSDAGAETHQVEYEPEEAAPEVEPTKPEIKVNTLIDNNNGSYSMILPVDKSILNLSNAGMAGEVLKMRARAALVDALKGKATSKQAGNTTTTRRVSSGSVSSRVIYVDSNLKPQSLMNPEKIKYVIVTGRVE